MPAYAENTIDALRSYLAIPGDRRPVLAAQPFATAPLSRSDADIAASLLRADVLARLKIDRAAEWRDKAVTFRDQVMRFTAEPIGRRPRAGWPLFISLHGGGSGPAALNDQQWRNQQTLYSPQNSLYIAPRAPADTWDMWHLPAVAPMLTRIIEDAVVFGGADPNRVYLLGYSAGGDGVYQLAPRMADRLAAASMMAGHPNDASPLNLRNLPFSIQVGALDSEFDRNAVARQWGERLDALRRDDPNGYLHTVKLYADKGHWMDREDRVALPWMAQFTRDPTPARVVFEQGKVPRHRFYWIAVPAGTMSPGQLIVATRRGQTIALDGSKSGGKVDILLNDAMLDLDQSVKVTIAGRVLFEGKATRTITDLAATIDDRPTDTAVFPAHVEVSLQGAGGWSRRDGGAE